MAESAVSFLIEYSEHLLVDEAKLLKDVRGEVRRIRDELESMRPFLRDADAKEDSNEGIKEWARQVRYTAYDTEDILDESILRIGQYNQDGRGVFRVLRKIAQSIKQLKARHRIGRQIQDMRARLSDISKRKDGYNLNRTEQVLSASSRGDGVHDPRLAALFAEESELMGIDEPRNRLISWLLSGEQRLSTMSVVGMGGLGKTTLVKTVYNSEQVKEQFETYAWVTVSQTIKNKGLLQSMIAQIYEAKQEQAPSGVDAMTDIELIQLLREYLESKRFVLVLDDIWEVEAWKFLNLAMPGREYGSRVILTMRRHDVASACCIGPSDDIYELEPLSPNTAWSLFCRRAFPANEDNQCPPELKQLAQSFVKKCGGLPLAIVTLGGLLASKDQTYSEWEMMHRSLGSELESNIQLKSMRKILWLSFNDLPYYLKSCFSYLSIFPEDYEIRRQQIIDLWIAEGFIEKKEGRTPEEVGESYFNALISRSLIQVTRREIGGEVLSFRIHDLLREIIIYKSREEDLIVSSNEEKNAFPDRVRRLSIYDKGEMVPKMESSSLRSFFIFGVNRPSVTSAITSLAGLRLLRVVCLERTKIKHLPRSIGKLTHLRYLDLSGSDIEELPESVSHLPNLFTLNLTGCVKLKRLPRVMGKMVSLRCLEIERTDSLEYLPKGLGRISGLRSLCKFIVGGGEGGGCKIGELQRLDSLKGILRIQYLERVLSQEDAQKARLWNKPHLRRLVLSMLGRDDADIERTDGVFEGLRPHENLEELKLFWYTGSKLPSWMKVMPCLRKLQLCGCPNLEGLLHHLDGDSLITELMIRDCPRIKGIAGSSSFVFLEKISVIDSSEFFSRGLPHLPNLKTFEIRSFINETLPDRGWEQLVALQMLEIWNCSELNSLPGGLTQLQSLENLIIFGCDKLERLPQGLGQLKKLKALTIGVLEVVTSLPDSLEQLKLLEHLEVSSCEKLESLPHGLQHLHLLERLSICGCPILSERCKREGVDWHKISHIPNIEIDEQRIQ